MATISNNNIAQAIYNLSREQGSADPKFLSKKVINFLVHRRLLSKSNDILVELEKIINKQNGIIVAKVSSASSLDTETKRKLTQILTKRYSAKDVKFVEKIDKNLLGGIRLEIGDEVIDLTIKNKIIKLQEYLTRNHE